jgi:glycosyltransferase involved in cell wall biosynthesis
MKFSFVTFTFGNTRLINLELTLKSVNENLEPDVECILIELNGNYAEELAEKYNFKYYVHNTDSKGKRSVGRNVGVLYTSGNYIIMHDNDIPIDKYFFNDVKSYAMKYDYFANYSDLYSMSKETTEDIFRNLSTTDYGYSLPRTKPSFDNVRHFGFRVETIVAPHGGSFTIKKDLYMKVGGFDPIYCGWGSEDSDFRFRALATMQNLKKYGQIKKDLIHTWHEVSYDVSSKDVEKNNLQNSKIFATRVYRYSNTLGGIQFDWMSGGLNEN